MAFKIKKASLTFRIKQKTFSMRMKNRHAYILLITTFNQSLSRISNVIKGHYSLLLSCNPCKIVFQHPLVVAFRRSSNLQDLLALQPKYLQTLLILIPLYLPVLFLAEKISLLALTFPTVLYIFPHR